MSEHIPIGKHDRVVVLTGAGVSAESGLSTFRDSGGLWEGERVEDVASIEAWHRDPERVWRFYSQRRESAAPCAPNPAHVALAELEKRIGDRFFLITQNVDDLHERAGSKRVLHMHGKLFESRCDRCHREPFHDTATYPTRGEHIRCECGGLIRPNIVWFGEMVLGLDEIAKHLDNCSVLLVVGTSGVVQPAASFVHWVNDRYTSGEEPVRTYYVGPEHPANASAFTKVFLGKAGELLPSLLK